MNPEQQDQLSPQSSPPQSLESSHPPNTQPLHASPQRQPAVADPGSTLSALGIVFGVFLPPVGLILSIIGRSKSKKSGFSGASGKIGIIVSVVFLIIVSVGATYAITSSVNEFNDIQQRARDANQRLERQNETQPRDLNSKTNDNANLEQLGTTADAVLQRDILRAIGAYETSSDRDTSFTVVAIRIVSDNGNDVTEEWTTANGSRNNVYSVRLLFDPKGGAQYFVSKK